jgi:cobalamin biosynthesis protein CobT
MVDHVGWEKYVNTMCERQGLSIKYHPFDFACTDGEIILVPQPDPVSWNEEDYILWAYKVIHEMLHNTPDSRELFPILKGKGKKINPLLKHISNLISDFDIEEREGSKYEGLKEFLDKARGLYTKKFVLPMYEKECEENSGQLWIFDMELRKKTFKTIEPLHEEAIKKYEGSVEALNKWKELGLDEEIHKITRGEKGQEHVFKVAEEMIKYLKKEEEESGQGEGEEEVIIGEESEEGEGEESSGKESEEEDGEGGGNAEESGEDSGSEEGDEENSSNSEETGEEDDDSEQLPKRRPPKKSRGARTNKKGKALLDDTEAREFFEGKGKTLEEIEEARERQSGEYTTMPEHYFHVFNWYQNDYTPKEATALIMKRKCPDTYSSPNIEGIIHDTLRNDADKVKHIRVSVKEEGDKSKCDTLAQRIRNLLTTRTKSSFIYGQEKGKLHGAHVHRGGFSNKVFKKSVEGFKIDTCVSLVLDFSGSMYNGNTRICTLIVAVDKLASCLQAIGIPFEITGFTEYFGQNVDSIFKPYGCPYKYAESMDRLIKATMMMGYTPDGEAILRSYNRIIKQPQKRKIIMVMTDGMPEVDPYRRNPLPFTQKIARRITRETPVELYGVGIQSMAPEQIYSNYTIIPDIRDLEPKLLELLSKYILKEAA